MMTKEHELELRLFAAHAENAKLKQQTTAPASCPNCAENLRYAIQLATWLWKKRFEQSSPDWKPLDTLNGVLSQIDNMIAVLRFDCPHCAEKDAYITTLENEALVAVNEAENQMNRILELEDRIKELEATIKELSK